LVLVVLLGMALSAAFAADPQPPAPGPGAPAGPGTTDTAAEDAAKEQAAVEEAKKVAAEVADKKHKGLLPDSVAKPTGWFEWGADLRVRQVFYNNIIDVTDAADDKTHFMRIRERVWFKIRPVEDVTIGVRVVGEWRCYFEPDRDTRFDEYFFDELYVEVKNIGGSPVSAKIGRQMLLYGRRWLIFEGTPLDGSRTVFFDAAKFTIDLDGDRKKNTTSLDLVWLQQRARHWDHLPVINNRNALTSEANYTGGLVYFTHRFNDALGIEAYYMYTDADAVCFCRQADNVHTYGARVFGKFENGISYSVELAGQSGAHEGQAVTAFGLCSEVKYTFDHPNEPEVHFQYEYLSGDDPGSPEYEGFEPMFARWPQWSELYVYSYLREEGIANVTNLQRIQVGGSVKLTKATKWRFNYNALLANQNTMAGLGLPGFSPTSNFRGHLFETRVDHKFTSWLSTHVVVEYFVPGGYYLDPKDGGVFARWEVLITF
jgi:hypothetical protein